MPNYKNCLYFIHHIIKRYREDDCTRSAAALTYTSLFAVVPLMTVMYATLSIVPSMQSVGLQVETFIFDNFIPAKGNEVKAYLQQFSQQARQLTGAGIALLILTAILMLRNIENIFNKIWRTPNNRQGVASFLLYWALLSLGPIFLVLAFGITTYLLSLSILADQVEKTGGLRHLLFITPYLLTSAAFTLIYAAIPNCKVPLRHAIVGGLVTALCFEAAKTLFTRLVANTSFEFIYGTFAAIPLFLLWIYVSWLIVLAGAVFVQALGSFPVNKHCRFDKLTLCLSILACLYQRHQQGNGISEQTLLQTPWLFNHYYLASDDWPFLRDKLIQSRLICATENNHYVLSRDLNHFTLWQLFQLLDPPSLDQDPHLDINIPWYQYYQSVMVNTQQYYQETLHIPLAELFNKETHD